MNAEDRRSWAWAIVAGFGGVLTGRGLGCITQGWPTWLMVTTMVISIPVWSVLMYQLLPPRTRYLTLQWKKSRR
jgi:hypothetical protein